MNTPELPIPLSPSQSYANLLLDFSGKQADPHGRDLIEDHSFSHKSSMLSQGIDLSELTPSRTGKNSITKKMSEYPSQLDPKKSSRRTLVLGSSEYDNAGESRNFDFAPERLVRKPTKGGLASESRMDLLSPLKSPNTVTSKRGASSRRSRASFLSDWRASESMPKRASSQSGMSIVGLLAMARKMGLIKKTHAYEDYMSQEQFNMIKDFSTGKFDKKEEKRTEQMERLKKKLMMDSHKAIRTKSHKKKAYLSDWKISLIPTLKRMHNEFRQHIRQIIAPNGMFRVIWDLFTMLLIFYDLILLPLILSFDIVIPGPLQIVDIIIAASFLCDIILNFNTGFYEKGMLVMDRKRVIANYLKGWFWIDLLASFPYEYAFSENDPTDDVSGAGSFQFIRVVRALRFIKILRFVRVFKLKNLFVKLESYIDLSATVTSIIGFLKLTLITMFIAHWFACAWHYLSVWELEFHPETWLTRTNIVDSAWTDRYVSSIYWATTTMITVGYGDIVPITTNEKIMAVVAMLVASAIFAYTMNRINVIMAGLETTSEQYQKALATITGYMRKKHVKKELQIKIKKYLEYALEVETSLDSNEECLNAFLNQSLKNELLLEIHGRILIENPIFTRFDNSLILKAALNLKEKIFSPEDPVFLEGDTDDCSVYIIHSGKVEIFNFKSQSFLKTLMKGSYFGEIAFFTGQARSASVRSTDFSALYLVKRSDFLDLLSEFPEDKEKFHEVKDRLSIYQDQTVVNIKCYSCESSDHIVNECPKVHAVVPKARLLQTYITRRAKFMSSYIRSGGRSRKNADRYTMMAHAAKRIQVQIWEGDLEVDKALLYVSSNIDLPEFSEHPWEMFHEENRKQRKVPSFEKGESARRKRSSIENKLLKTPGSQTLSNLDVDSKSGSSGNIVGSKQELKKKKKKQQKANSAVISVPANKSQKDKKKDAIENDIDKIENFKYYFTHNNFEELFPPPLENKKTMNFDYFSHSDTTKDTLKRFITLLRERVRVRKEHETKDKGKKNASFFKFGRSKFYKERSMSISSRKIHSPGPGSPVSTPKTPKTPNAPKSAKLRKGEMRFDMRFDNDSDNSRSDSEF